ncbi:509_t:CDS:2, partial [Scutellospora calospora]
TDGPVSTMVGDNMGILGALSFLELKDSSAFGTIKNTIEKV